MRRGLPVRQGLMVQKHPGTRSRYQHTNGVRCPLFPCQPPNSPTHPIACHCHHGLSPTPSLVPGSLPIPMDASHGSPALSWDPPWVSRGAPRSEGGSRRRGSSVNSFFTSIGVVAGLPLCSPPSPLSSTTSPNPSSKRFASFFVSSASGGGGGERGGGTGWFG